MKVIDQNKNLKIDIKAINNFAKNPASFVADCESAYSTQLDNLVHKVQDGFGRYRIIALAGPSSSGKTTTAHKLSQAFDKRGICAPVVSLDDFYLGKMFYPKLPNGQPDMESVDALDLPLINKTLKALIEDGVASFPIFGFEKSCRSDKSNVISLGEDEVVIIEGIHALNPRLVEMLDKDKIFRAYVSTRTKYMLEDAEVLTPKDVRLIRRMVRDHNFRGRAPVDTLLGWQEVLDGEEKYIYPFRDDVEFKINSAIDYEGCVFHHYIHPIIEELNKKEISLGKLKDLFEILEMFDDIDSCYIPDDSLLREFVG